MNTEDETPYSSTKLLNDFFSAVEITKNAIDDLVVLMEENVDDEQAVECFNCFVQLSAEYVRGLDQLNAKFAVGLNWLPPVDNLHVDDPSSFLLSRPMELKYADGNTPWSFWLSYGPSPEFDSLQVTIKDEWKQGNLRKVHEAPAVGSYVIGVDRNIVFRAIVLSINKDKVKVRSIDETFVKVLKLENIYFMKKRLNSLYAQTVQCCLTKDNSLISLWNSDLGEVFKNTLKESSLCVTFVEECANCVPAKFLVKISAYNDNSPTNINEWICDKIFPELIKYQDMPEALTLENLPENIVDPYFKEDDADVEDRTVANRFDYMNVSNESDVSRGSWSSQLILSSNAVIPSWTMSQLCSSPLHLQNPLVPPPGAIAAQYTTTTVYGDSNHEDLSSFKFSAPRITTTTSSIIMKPENIVNTTLNVNTPAFKPRKKMAITITEPTNETNINLKPSVEVVKGTSTTIKIERPKESNLPDDICLKYFKNGFCLVPSCPKRHVSEQEARQEKENTALDSEPSSCASSSKSTVIYNLDEEDKKENDFKAQQSLNKVEAEKMVRLLVDDDDDDDDDDLDEPCINDGYMPTDETRLCQFTSKNGRCWKPQCKKEHINVFREKWTTDRQCTTDKTYNNLDLPKLNETIELLVTTVINPYTFYARLPDYYSDIGEGIEDIETFETLHKALHDPKNIKQYQPLMGVEAGIGEMYLVLSHDSNWKRATVLESNSKKSISVFYVDYGDQETVPEVALRHMEDRFNYLPAQAVRCHLYNLYCSLDDQDLKRRGKKFLESAIKGEVIVGTIMNRNEEETSLDLLVTVNNKEVNKVMVSKGFCDEIRNN